MLTGTCTGACPSPLTLPAPGCDLVRCKYLGSQNWDGKGYTFRAANGDSGSDPCGFGVNNAAACGRRCTGAPPCTNTSPYTSWGYTMDRDGKVEAHGGAPKPN